MTPPAPPYEMLTSTDVLPDDPSSSIALLGPPLLTPDPSEVAVPLKTASLAPVALLSTADDSLVDEVELLELEEVETLDELDVVEG